MLKPKLFHASDALSQICHGGRRRHAIEGRHNMKLFLVLSAGWNALKKLLTLDVPPGCSMKIGTTTGGRMKTMSKNVDIDITFLHTGACSVVHVRGDVDLTSSPELRAALLGLFKRGSLERVIVDLQGAKHIDSSGIASLVEGWHEAKKRNARFILSGLNESARRMLDLTRLSGVFEITPTVDEALGSRAA